MEGGFGAEVGLRTGDVLVALGPAPVVLERDLLVLLRYLSDGDEVEATWAREGELMSATGVL